MLAKLIKYWLLWRFIPGTPWV